MRIRLTPEFVARLAVLTAGVAIHEGAHALVLNAAGTTTRFKFYGIAAATDYRDSERQPGARTILVTLVAGPVAELAFYSLVSFAVPGLAPLMARVAFLQFASNALPVIPGSDGWKLGRAGLGLWQDRRLLPAYRCPRHRRAVGLRSGPPIPI
jgi:hypothetical protein